MTVLMIDKFPSLNYEELTEIEGGGGLLTDIGGFVGKTWNTLYNTGRDFGRSIVNALIP